MTTNTRAAATMRALVENNLLASQYEEFVNRTVRKGETFYTEALRMHGKEAAESALALKNKRNHWSEFAAAIAPIGEGMLAMTEADTAGVYCQEITSIANMGLPRYYEIDQMWRMIVILNRDIPPRGWPRASADWGVLGRLGLQAVVLQAGVTQEGNRPAAQLGLVLRLRDVSSQDNNVDGFALAAFDLGGRRTGLRYGPPRFGEGAYFLSKLGLKTMDESMINGSFDGGAFDDMIGFPGAADYLANTLPSLGEYLTDLAAQLTAHNL